MRTIRSQVASCAAGLRVVVVLASLVLVGFWQVIAARADVFAIDLGQSFMAKPKVDRVWLVFRLFLNGVAQLHWFLGRVFHWTSHGTSVHRKIATNIDDSLMALRTRF